MENLWATLLIAFVIIALCLFMLGISWFLTGKSRFKTGMCGKVPTMKKSKKNGCGDSQSCALCGSGGNDDVSEEQT